MAGERSAAAKASTVFNRLMEIDREERAELEASPGAIKEKHDARRAREKAKSESDDPKVWKLAVAMYEAEKDS